MKKLLFALLLMATSLSVAQGVVSGKIVAADYNDPLAGATVVQSGTSNGTITDFDGNFTLNVSANSGAIEISYLGYEKTRKLFTLSEGNVDLGTIIIQPDADALTEIVIVGKGIIDLAADRQTPIAVSTITATEIQARGVGNVEFTEVMKNTPSVYVSNQAGGFGDSQMSLRGFDQVNTAFLLNGQPINGMEDGRMYWSNWSGMADVANAVQVQRGLGSSKLAISSVGGTVNIVSKAAGKKEGGFARMMTGNDSYMKGTMSYDSGLKGKWAYSFMLDHWQGHRKWANGTAGQGQNYFIGLGYVPNEQHAFNFMITGAPQWHDQNFSVPLEAYEQFGLRHNNNSGFLDGERYTFRRNYYHKPVANLNWDWDINEKLDLSTVLYASWGRGGGTGPAGSSGNINPFRNDRGEIDFDDIVANNISNNPNGIGTFGSSAVRRMSVNNHNWYGLLSNLEFNPSENWSLNIGVDGRMYNGHHWYQLNDLLGLNGYADNFGYGSQRPSDYVISETFEANPWASLFSFADEGQRFNYDYSENINYIGTFGQVEFSTEKFSAFAQGALSTQSYQREGRAEGNTIEGVNGLGKSDLVSKMGFNVKGGMGYTFVEGHTVFANAGLYSRQPFLDNIFDDVRNSNYILEGENAIDNEEITGLEAGYRIKGRNIILDINVYHTTWGNRFISGGFIPGDPNATNPIDQVDRFQRFTGVTQIHNGFEYEFKYKYSNVLMLRTFGSLGNWKYDGSTPVETRDAETNVLLDRREVNLNGTKVGNAPQTSFGFGFNYKITEGLSIDADFNIFEDFYGFVNARDVVESSISGTPYEAERLPAYTLLDTGITYTFEMGGQRFTIRGNVYNMANEIYLNQRDSFGYFYGNGRTWNASIRYDF